MAARANADISELLTCSVCFDDYKDPRTIPCGHSFCLHCLESISDGKMVFECPVCRAETAVPEGGASQYVIAFVLKSLKDAVERTEGEEDYHFYCEKCHELLTYQMAATTHQGHKYHNIQVSYANHLEALKKSLIRLRVRTEDMAADREVLLQVESDILKQKEQIREEIVIVSDEIIDAIRKATQQKLVQLDEIFDKKMEIAMQQRQESDEMLKTFVGIQEEVEHKLSTSSCCQLLSKKTEILKQIHSATCMMKKKDFKPKEKANVKFVRNSSLVSSSQNIGYLFPKSSPSYSVGHDPLVMAGLPSTFTVFFNPSHPPYDSTPSIQCTLTSCDTGNTTTTVCDFGKVQGFSHSFEMVPVDRGEQLLTITTDDMLTAQEPITFIAHPSPYMRGRPLKEIKSLKKPIGIAITKNNTLIVVNQGSNSIEFIDDSGRVSCDIKFTDPHGIALTDDEAYFIVTDKHSVRLIETLSGNVIETAGGEKKGYKRNLFSNPTGVAINPMTKQIYVADTDNHRIVVLSEMTLTRVTEFGKKGSSLGTFDEPMGMEFNSDKLYIVNNGSSCIDVYSAIDHKPLSRIGASPTRLSYEGLSRPSSLTIDTFGYIYITEVTAPIFSVKSSAINRISIYKTDGQFVRSFGGKGRTEESFYDPSGIAIDRRDGTLYVCDTDNNRIVLL
ncbi:PREDICTED: tripartite motif-containing protein 3-like [Amphimedon queenslandica]|uniref:RING-type domain-containing protein n=1 Tax=Amphimedon queenslandica TaxID=400682 RepID=A0A1X7VQ71_AMPQE|nr:PREDICTED: tripartite motif-containing protein 3-like [Amphimedon queenslandica]|eukprot:XP_011409580.1 PREDICTED: tripartite motif-containing protein 3-like [Amphimedon queenslandica]